MQSFCYLLLTGLLPALALARHPERLTVYWGVLANQDNGRARWELTLVNQDTVALPASGWTLYFNFMRPILSESTPPSVRLTHVNGDFYRLEPTEAFAPLPPGGRRTLSFESPGPLIKAIDAPSGLYFVFRDAPDRPIPVRDVRVLPFASEFQTRRHPADRLPVPTPALRYYRNASLRLLPADSLTPVVPTPRQLTRREGHWTLDRTAAIAYDPALAREAAFLADALAPLLGTRLRLLEGAERPASIRLRLGAVYLPDGPAGPEAYHLIVDPEAGITLTGTDAAGAFYGIQTLQQLIDPSFYRQTSETIPIPALEVRDAPRFGYRGLHLDVARNFQPKEVVLRLLDLMARYKLNRFHFHLTDDEGWRLEIEDLPELTEVGGCRGHTETEATCLVPSHGSGPIPGRPPGSGYYTREDFIEILRYATARHIEVIPEIDVPGHARAAIKAMEARYARLKAAGRPEAEAAAYRLVDPADTSVYRSVQGWNDNVINVCLPSTYRFLEKVVDELRRLYDEAGAPLHVVHTGGDEVPHGAWAGSPACRAVMQAEGIDDPAALQQYFLDRFDQILRRRGLRTAGWEEIGLIATEENGRRVHRPNPRFRDRGFLVYAWNNIWGSGAEDHAYRLANAGYDVILSLASNLYFDLAYTKHPDEAGLYWAGFVDNDAPYRLEPFDLFLGPIQHWLGHTLPPEAFAHHERLTTEGRRHIVGLQGQLWGETLRTPDRVFYMAVPRMLALAERAWAERPAWSQIVDPEARQQALQAAWNAFANRLGQRELPRLDALYGETAPYRLPPPGAVVEDGLLKANVALPGLTIRYTLDGSEPTAASPRYTGPVRLEGHGEVRLRTFDTNGRGSRTVRVVY
ncbi:family 20 glycosylhydrolase [Rhodothermus marinus]|uniref:beta-N-acetylhexosaminidase n=1 Tax=Rhodothermus marinus (strain ATCC 43812 / DSM 4252 / R-10) TaxID=518766 RepID=D0MH76_RHOM4|nr:family 20 glycosylhydrolase [Rhodothermus marinus]ACY49665.1 Beta-N-acetylhexosaminidase [Rhodothermus marinus DSM 4252]